MFKCFPQDGQVLRPRGGGSRCEHQGNGVSVTGKEAALPGGQDRQMFAGFTTRGGATLKTANTDMHAGGAEADMLAVIADHRVDQNQAPCAMSTPEAQEERLLPIRSDMEWVGRGKHPLELRDDGICVKYFVGMFMCYMCFPIDKLFYWGEGIATRG